MEAETSSEKGQEPTRLAIVDDHQLAREGLRDMLADVSDIEVVGEASVPDPDQAITTSFGRNGRLEG